MTDKVFTGITLLGLGPGDPALLTRQAWGWLQTSPEIVTRAGVLPAGLIPAGVPVTALEAGADEDGLEALIRQVLELGQRPQGVTYATPGHPLVNDAAGAELLRRARAQGIAVRVIDGLSSLESVCTALEISPLPRLALLDALEVGRGHVPSFPAAYPALILQVNTPETAARVRRALNALYPDEHAVRLVHAAGDPAGRVEELPLGAVESSTRLGWATALFVPPLGEQTSLEEFHEVVARLRAPDGCPWDREQTHDSLRPHLLEETYEALDALDAGDVGGMAEEFGDLLLQIVLHAQIAGEAGEFTLADILRGINRKIVRRHPHVFGDVSLDGVDGVLRNWEKLKAAERKANGQDQVKGLLDGVSKALPALAQAQEYQDRAARVGFDWKDVQPVLDKVVEELREIKEAESPEDRADELGDLLFAVVNVIRWYRVDAETALRGTNSRFRRRFAHVEQRAREQGRHLSDMTLEEMDVFWDEAKALGL